MAKKYVKDPYANSGYMIGKLINFGGKWYRVKYFDGLDWHLEDISEEEAMVELL